MCGPWFELFLGFFGVGETAVEPLANDDSPADPENCWAGRPAPRVAAAKSGRSWLSKGPLKRAPPAPPGRHADTQRVRGVDNDAPPPRLMLFAVRSAGPPLKASTAKSGLRGRLPRRRVA